MSAPREPAGGGDAPVPAPTPWWEANFDRDYLARYAHRDDAEARLAIDLLAQHGTFAGSARILDLGCGAGRHLAELRRRRVAAFGLDYSRDLLAVAAQVGRAPVVRGDMRALPFVAGSFGAAIQMFTAFGYFEADAENRAVLAEVARVLAPAGHYALDLMSRGSALAAAARGDESRDLGDGRLVLERRRFDSARSRIEKEVVITAGAGERRQRFESVRVFTRDEIETWLRDAGLAPLAAFGDYGGAPFDEATSPRLLVLAQRIRATGS
jgi:SAM-dependent methyltransferase